MRKIHIYAGSSLERYAYAKCRANKRVMQHQRLTMDLEHMPSTTARSNGVKYVAASSKHSIDKQGAVVSVLASMDDDGTASAQKHAARDGGDGGLNGVNETTTRQLDPRNDYTAPPIEQRDSGRPVSDPASTSELSDDSAQTVSEAALDATTEAGGSVATINHVAITASLAARFSSDTPTLDAAVDDSMDAAVDSDNLVDGSMMEKTQGGAQAAKKRVQ